MHGGKRYECETCGKQVKAFHDGHNQITAGLLRAGMEFGSEKNQNLSSLPNEAPAHLPPLFGVTERRFDGAFGFKPG